MRRILGLCLSLFLVLPASAAEPALLQVLSEPLPDPYVFHWMGEWTISGTGGFFYHGPAFRPDAMLRADLQLRYSDPAVRPVQVWGFVPYRHRDGSWHAYATLHYGDFRTVVAHFLPECDGKAGKPITRWRFDTVLVGDLIAGKTTAYESKILIDDDGTIYLVYSASPARHQNVHIWAQRMLDPSGLIRRGSPARCLIPTGVAPKTATSVIFRLSRAPTSPRLGQNTFSCTVWAISP